MKCWKGLVKGIFLLQGLLVVTSCTVWAWYVLQLFGTSVRNYISLCFFHVLSEWSKDQEGCIQNKIKRNVRYNVCFPSDATVKVLLNEQRWGNKINVQRVNQSKRYFHWSCDCWYSWHHVVSYYVIDSQTTWGKLSKLPVLTHRVNISVDFAKENISKTSFFIGLFYKSALVMNGFICLPEKSFRLCRSTSCNLCAKMTRIVQRYRNGLQCWILTLLFFFFWRMC